jgi:hypothetical protein
MKIAMIKEGSKMFVGLVNQLRCISGLVAILQSCLKKLNEYQARSKSSRIIEGSILLFVVN